MTGKPKVYIDGREGTTGLQIYDRLKERGDLELLLIDEDKRKDPEERKKYLNAADIVFLCLPDGAAREAVSMVEKEAVRIIDASTAHRTAPGLGLRPAGAVRCPQGGHPPVKEDGQPGVPRHRLHRGGLPADRQEDPGSGGDGDLLLPHGIFRGRQEDDRRVRGLGAGCPPGFPQNLRPELKAQASAGDEGRLRPRPGSHLLPGGRRLLQGDGG